MIYSIRLIILLALRNRLPIVLWLAFRLRVCHRYRYPHVFSKRYEGCRSLPNGHGRFFWFLHGHY